MADYASGTEDSDFFTFLKGISLDEFHSTLVEQGIKETVHLEDVDEKDAIDMGMSKFQSKRLLREFTSWKARKTSTTDPKPQQASQPEYRVSDKSVILQLAPGFKEFFQTRDGQGNILVPAKKLQEKFKQLWYPTPINPTQRLSNTFILEMAEYRQQFEKSLRSCELWCRKHRGDRIQLLLACAQPSTVSTWTVYYKKKSVEGIIQLAKERYPQVAELLDNYKEGQNVPRVFYDSLCKFQESLEEAQSLAKESVEKCQQLIASSSDVPKAEGLLETKKFYSKLLPTLKTTANFIAAEVSKVSRLVDEAKTKYGASSTSKALDRKKRKHQNKENKRKLRTRTSDQQPTVISDNISDGHASDSDVHDINSSNKNANDEDDRSESDCDGDDRSKSDGDDRSESDGDDRSDLKNFAISSFLAAGTSSSRKEVVAMI